MNDRDTVTSSPEETPATPVRQRGRRALSAVLAACLATTLCAVPAVAMAGPGPQWPDDHADDGYAYGVPPWASVATATLDATEATAAQETGLMLVSSTLADGGEAAGTGMVLSSDGLVVTNHHVVEGSTAITVTVATSGATYTARLLGTDAVNDIAVLQLVDAEDLAPVDTDTSALTVGQAVTAVGDAYGDGGSLTAAEGTVTALHQTITTQSTDGSEPQSLTNLIEIDADIVSGDSGGALLDADGDVVGMNTAASSGSADITGYAIPVRKVLRIVDKVVSGNDAGPVELGYDGYLGVALYDGASTATVAKALDATPAQDAGLEAGDTITAVGGTAVTTAEELRTAIAAHAPGDVVTLTWTDSAGSTHSAPVTLAQAPVA